MPFSSQVYDDSDDNDDNENQESVFWFSVSPKCALTGRAICQLEFFLQNNSKTFHVWPIKARNMDRLPKYFSQGFDICKSSGWERKEKSWREIWFEKRKKSWPAQEEYIWKLTTKLPKLCQRFKKYSQPENLINFYSWWVQFMPMDRNHFYWQVQ